MHRTQMYLGDEEIALLDAHCASTGASRAELVRRAIRMVYGEPTTSEKTAALGASTRFLPPNQAGTDYVDAIRSAADEQVARSKSR